MKLSVYLYSKKVEDIRYVYFSNKAEIHRDPYHNHLSPLIPYKAIVASAACLVARISIASSN